IGTSACETRTLLRRAARRGANLGSGASQAARLWITCEQGVDCLWIGVDRNKLIFLTAVRCKKAYYWLSAQANRPPAGPCRREHSDLKLSRPFAESLPAMDTVRVGQRVLARAAQAGGVRNNSLRTCRSAS